MFMNFGIETETVEFKKTTAELNAGCVSICAMLNKHGVGTLYFGIKPNGDAIGQVVSENSLRDVSKAIYESIRPQIYPTIQKIDIDQNKSLIKVEFNGSETPYSVNGKYYLRTADEDRMINQTELANMFMHSGFAKKWDSGISNTSEKNIDNRTLKVFFEKGVQAGRLPAGKFSAIKLLEKIGLSKGGYLTYAGKLLFSNTKPIILKMAQFATNDKVTFLDMKTEEGNIFDLLEISEQYIFRNIRWRIEITNMERDEVPEIPIAVIREILANSFAHASYNTSTEHEICIHPNKITIYNPGSFASDYLPSDYEKKNLPSFIRNEQIAKCLYLCKKIEKFGSGLQRISSLCKDSKIKYKFENSSEGFTVILYRNTNVSDITNVTLDVTLNSSEMAVLALLKKKPNQTRAELASKTSKTVRTVQRALDSLRTKGYIQRDGAKSESNWIVLK